MSKACQHVVSTFMRLSLASADSIAAPNTTANLLLIHTAGMPLCLDESLAGPAVLRPGENGVTPPVVKRRVEPQFPSSARVRMGRNAFVLIVVEATISSEGCVRNLRLLKQSPYPELNAAALIALAQWGFDPGRLNGIPVDVLFDLSMNFRIR